MARHTADIDVESYTTEYLTDYINDAAPVAANLPDGEYGKAQITANVEAAIAELKARKSNGVSTDGGEDDTDDESHLTGGDREPSDAERGFGETVDGFESAVADAVATDGGKDPVDEAIDAEVGDDDHYLRHVTDEESTFKVRHDRAIQTRAEDGEVVHTVFESAADGHHESLSWSRGYFSACPVCDADVDKESDDGDAYVETWSCAECPWSLRRASDTDPHAIEGEYKPLWSKTTTPHDFDDEPGVDFDTVVEGSDSKAEAANLIRELTLSVKSKATGTFKDAAYVSAEYDGKVGDDGTEKVAEAFIDTFECGHCGDEVEAPAKRSHKVFGDVCPECEDVTVWSVEDADLPEDVADKMDTHKSFNASKIVALLRDVKHWGNFVAAVNDDKDADEVTGIKTGKGGQIGVTAGGGRKGTGLRRPSGFAHNFTHFRTCLRDAEDTGLIERVNREDSDVDDPNVRWVATDKGDRVFAELARCETCGDRVVPMLRTSTYTVRRRTKRDRTLTTACPTCDDLRSKREGGMVLESSATDWSLSELPGVEYDVE